MRKKRIKKGFLPYMTGFFQSLVCKCPCRRGCTKKCQDQAKRLFFLFFLFIYFSYDFLLAIFFCCHLCLLVHWPQRYYCKFTRRAQSGLRPEFRAASQSSSVFDRQTKEECFAQCSPTARHYGRILCSIVKKLNIYYFERFQYILYFLIQGV